MYKKIIIVICLFLLCGCTSTNINKLSLEEIIDNTIKEPGNKPNVNRKGYKYYIPLEFNIKNDRGYIQELNSKKDNYYLNVDVVSYFYKNNIKNNHSLDDYAYYEFYNDKKSGYLRITKNNDTFFIELCYNYAIIEVEVDESNLRYAISRGIIILNSIEYNDLIIEKYITENDLDISETIYKVPEPSIKDDSKDILEYIEPDDIED